MEIPFDIWKEYEENERVLTIELKLGGTFIDVKTRYKENEVFFPILFPDV